MGTDLLSRLPGILQCLGQWLPIAAARQIAVEGTEGLMVVRSHIKLGLQTSEQWHRDEDFSSWRGGNPQGKVRVLRP